jgi:L-aspartate oxidase
VLAARPYFTFLSFLFYFLFFIFMKTSSCDFIVVGSGIAGLRAAMELVKQGSVKVLCKGDPWQSNTRFAQGGIAAAMQEGDTVEFHLQDTLTAGDGLCYEPAVRVLVEEGPRRIQELVQWGAEFDRVNGKFLFGREGAHSHSRILHAGDATGHEIIRALLNWVHQTRGIEITCNQPALDLIVENGRCTGVQTIHETTGEHSAIFARAILLATGGAGQIYSQTTNPPVATGDGTAVAFRAGCEMMDLEFFQFHPTALHLEGVPRFLLTEALRGEGAVLRNQDGRAFMKEYHPQADLAPRDIVSRAMVTEMRKTGSAWILLDATSIPRKKLRARFPNIYEFLETHNLALSKDLIPVSPSAHYWMGGVRTNLEGRTSLPGLYAAGEVACNGVHGANRLASNSLLEGLVFGARAGEAMIHADSSLPIFNWSQNETKSAFSGNAAELRKAIQDSNWKNLGLIRNQKGIQENLEFTALLPGFVPKNLEELELQNLIDCSKLIGLFALNRKESRGSHFRDDFPEKNPQWMGRHSILRKGEIELTTLLEDL